MIFGENQVVFVFRRNCYEKELEKGIGIRGGYDDCGIVRRIFGLR